MRAEKKRDIARQLKALLSAGTTSLGDTFWLHPVEVYKSEARFERERSLLFQKYPFVAGYEAELEEVGSFVTREICCVPILLTKDEAGEIRGFVNICRHRGNRLCRQADGQQSKFVCQYHGWVYDNKGSCLSVANAAAFEGLDTKSVGLQALSVQVRHGLIWVQLPGAEHNSVVDFLGQEIDEELAEYAHHTRKIVNQREDMLNFNWKLGVETFLEIFHVSTLHKATIAPHFYRGLMVHDNMGDHSRIAAARPSLVSADVEEGEENISDHILLIYLLFPNTVYLFQLHHVEIYSFFPGTQVDNCVVRTALLRTDGRVADRAQRLWDKNWDFLCRSVYEEDFCTAALVQDSIESGAIEHFVFGRNEVVLHRFHERLQRALDESTCPAMRPGENRHG